MARVARAPRFAVMLGIHVFLSGRPATFHDWWWLAHKPPHGPARPHCATPQTARDRCTGVDGPCVET